MSETILDSGNRREFGTGAVRDIAEGKGRMDLVPLEIYGRVIEDPILINIGLFIRKGEEYSLRNAITFFINNHTENKYTALIGVSQHYEAGCKKYGDRNWEKGIPLHCYIDSATRHYTKFMRGDKDERHDRAFVWNLLGALWTLEYKKELIDLPFNEQNNEG